MIARTFLFTSEIVYCLYAQSYKLFFVFFGNLVQMVGAVKYPLLYLSSVHGGVAAKIPKVPGSGNFNTAGMLWCSSTAQEYEKRGNYECCPALRIADCGLRIVKLKF
jgi:hypothetical protein